MKNNMDISNIKVLLCLNGDKDNNKFVLDRNGYILRYALQEANISYTYNFNQDYDIVYLLSLNQLKAYYSMVKPNKRKPVILSLFNDLNDFKIEEIEDSEGEFKANFSKLFKQIEDKKDNITLVSNFSCQDLILSHFNCPFNKNVIYQGVKDYSKKEYSKVENEAFRKYYKLPDNRKIIISYGEYDYSKGLDTLEALARILPDFEFFFFGSGNGILSNSKHYAKTNKIMNLHYQGNIPEELYHSLLLNASCIFLPDKFHFDSLILLEAMKQNIPIVSSKNPLLYDLLIDKQTCFIGETIEDFYNYIVNIDTFNYAKQAKEFVSSPTFTIENYADQIKKLFFEILSK